MALFALEDEYAAIAQQMQLDVDMGEFMPPFAPPARLGDVVPLGYEALGEVPGADAAAGAGAGAIAAGAVIDAVPSPIVRLPPPVAPAPLVRHARQPRKARPDPVTRISSTQMTLALNDPSDLVADFDEVRFALQAGEMRALCLSASYSYYYCSPPFDLERLYAYSTTR